MVTYGYNDVARSEWVITEKQKNVDTPAERSKVVLLAAQRVWTGMDGKYDGLHVFVDIRVCGAESARELLVPLQVWAMKDKVPIDIYHEIPVRAN